MPTIPIVKTQNVGLKRKKKKKKKKMESGHQRLNTMIQAD